MAEERRRLEDKNWDEMIKFIAESRAYREGDKKTQQLFSESILGLKEQVTKQNGRVFELEKFRDEIKVKIQDRKDNGQNIRDFLTVTATVIMAASAIVMYFRK